MPDTCRERLIIFTRYPEPGNTKTRLISRLGSHGAAELQRRMTEHLLSTVCRLTSDSPVEVEIRYDGGNGDLMKAWLGEDFTLTPQSDGELDERMGSAFSDAFNRGVRRAVIIGTDIPGITADILHQAFESLKQNDLVFGPAADGGYYLIGLHAESFKSALPALFTAIPWGTEGVLDQSLKIAKTINLTVAVVNELQDVDRPEDLWIWENVTGTDVNNLVSDKISVIIPTLNESATIVSTLDHIGSTKNVEVIVVDGGSTDGTVEQAESYGAKIIRAPRGRAVQMNTGAAAATGDILLFLHADTLLPEGFAGHIRQTLKISGVVAGAFELGIDSPVGSLRVMEKVANWRSRSLQMPYGDQAMFLTDAMFQEVGGFPEMPIMEDFAFIKKLQKKGRIEIVPAAVMTSPRRWLSIGVWKTWIVNRLMVAGYTLGIAPETLARWYNREKGLK